MNDLLQYVLNHSNQLTDGAEKLNAFALLKRRDGAGIEVLVGDVVDVERLSDIPHPATAAARTILGLVPFRQVSEKGFACHDDGSPLRCLLVAHRQAVPLVEVLNRLPTDDPGISGIGFDVDDRAYAELVERVLVDEIGTGQGANFVIRRDYLARFGDQPGQGNDHRLNAAHVALVLLRRLLIAEPAAYWTFAVHAGDITMVGATPERHVALDWTSAGESGRVLMNPISGTYRYPPDGPNREGLLDFLADTKETDELVMVVDEELKMMSQVCADGGRVLGPYLRPLSELAHTEYVLQGRTEYNIRDVLRTTMFAPTVLGSPIRNAARVIVRYEQSGRGYYSGVLALLELDEFERETLDAPILIRTAYLTPDGLIRTPVGATLVRHSLPANEVAETHAKAAAVLRALGVLEELPAARVHGRPPRAESGASAIVDLAGHPGVAAALAARNEALAEFWLIEQEVRPLPGLVGRTAVIIDAEDDWTAMLAHLLRNLGMTVKVSPWTAPGDHAAVDIVVAGPGPGDPTALGDPRINILRGIIARQLSSHRPLLAVCLSHQILCELLGYNIRLLGKPYQGQQRKVDLFGRSALVGFYNSFAVVANSRAADNSTADLEEAADPMSGELVAVRGPAFVSVQFHLESVLSTTGIDVLGGLLSALLE